MLTREFDWLRGSDKLDKRLRREVLQTYSELRGIPCLLQKGWLWITSKKKKYPVIIKYQKNRVGIQELADTIRQLGCNAGKDMSELDMLTATVNIDALKKLIDTPQVEKISYDGHVQALLDVASSTVKADYFWEQQFTGKGVKVAVIDTGISPHEDLTKPKNRIIGFVDLVNNRSNPYDDNGHGTHVAGCIAGNGQLSKGKYRAPAYNAELIGIKVLNKMGSGSMSKVIEGINWCITNRQQVQVICLSLGSPAENTAADDPVCLAVGRAWEKGIVVCAAAGNDGPKERTVSSPGIEPKIITVGATDDKRTVQRRDDSIAAFSSRGPTIDGGVKPDVVAPGTNIVSLRVPNSYVEKQMQQRSTGDQWYTAMSGTSMATPIVVGIVAQMLEKNPDLNPDEVKKIIMSNAEDMGVSKWHQGAGSVQTVR